MHEFNPKTHFQSRPIPDPTVEFSSARAGEREEQPEKAKALKMPAVLASGQGMESLQGRQRLYSAQ